MENKKSFVIIIDKQTKLGSKEFVRGSICGITTALICITDGVEPQDVFTAPINGKETHDILRIKCTPKAFELIKQHMKKQYPEVCLFGEYELN